MSVYERAVRHALMMAGVVFACAAFVVLVDQVYGHSTLAFAASIFVLLIANVRMLRFNCPRCGSNLFLHGWLALPWPNRTCSRCGLELAKAPPNQ